MSLRQINRDIFIPEVTHKFNTSGAPPRTLPVSAHLVDTPLRGAIFSSEDERY
jgi:hypothetical protein